MRCLCRQFAWHPDCPLHRAGSMGQLVAAKATPAALEVEQDAGFDAFAAKKPMREVTVEYLTELQAAATLLKRLVRERDRHKEIYEYEKVHYLLDSPLWDEARSL